MEVVSSVLPRGRPQGKAGPGTVETSLLMNMPHPLIWALPFLIPQRSRHMLFLLELKSFIDTEIRFSCAKKSPSLYFDLSLLELLWQFALSFLFSLSILSDPLRPHELQHARLPCPLSPRVCSNSCPFFAYSTLTCVLSQAKGAPGKFQKFPEQSQVCNRDGPGKFVLEEGH